MKRVIVTAGPTREAIDPVRFISNKSTGKMGYAIAEEAAKNSHVFLISGPTNLTPPKNCTFVAVTTAEEMFDKVNQLLDDADVLIMTAAVADYRPKFVADNKLKKGEGTFVIEMERTKDILFEMSKRKEANHTFIGFAAETENLLENAKGKLERKKLDWIVANDVSNPKIGFGSDRNAVTIIGTNRKFSLPIMSKKKLAKEICKLY